MTTFAPPTLLDGEEITSTQHRCWPDRRDEIVLDDFTYDLTHRCDEESRQERDDILDELLIDDVYQLRTFTRPGDVWVDAGCHLGIFSIAAMMHGADVSAMLDLDSSAAWMGELNARCFLQQLARRDLRRQRIRPTGFHYKVGSPYELNEAGMLTRETWEGRRSCLKLDVQGAEVMVLALGGGEIIADGFDRLVMEWHSSDTSDIDELLGDRWRVLGMERHTDALLKTDTNIVWAETVDSEPNVV